LESGGGVAIGRQTRPQVHTIHKGNPVQEFLAILLLDIRFEHVPTMPVSLKHPLHTDVVHVDILSIKGNELTAALEHGDGVEIGRTEAQAKRVDSDHAVP
jgi:hypothetical protein